MDAKAGEAVINKSKMTMEEKVDNTLDFNLQKARFFKLFEAKFNRKCKEVEDNVNLKIKTLETKVDENFSKQQLTDVQTTANTVAIANCNDS